MQAWELYYNVFSWNQGRGRWKYATVCNEEFYIILSYVSLGDGYFIVIGFSMYRLSGKFLGSGVL